MEIIMENYIWFAVAGVILLMALIGFIAEKTDFGRKEFEKKIRPIKEPKQKKQKETPEVVEVIEETPVEEVTPIVEEITDVTELPEVIEEDLTAPLSDDSWGEPITVANDTVEDVIMEEPVVEEMTFEEPTIEPSVEEMTFEEPTAQPVVEEMPNTFTEEEITEEPTEITIDQPKIDLENLELPAIDSLKEEESDDDVWKF